MPTPVFPVECNYPLTHMIAFATFVGSMGDGHEQRINKNIAWSRADGEGNVASYKGINRFSISITKAPHTNQASPTYKANLIWNFYKARLGSYEAFYFYNPAEHAIDLTGAETTGRYLVRFAEANLSRVLFVLKLFNHGVDLVEIRA